MVFCMLFLPRHPQPLGFGYFQDFSLFSNLTWRNIAFSAQLGAEWRYDRQ